MNDTAPKPAEVILHVSAIVSERVTREVVLCQGDYETFVADMEDPLEVGPWIDRMLRDERNPIIKTKPRRNKKYRYNSVSERAAPEPPPRFQTRRDTIVADLTKVIAPNGPTAEQVDTVAKLLDAIPAGWHYLLPLPESNTYESDNDGGLCPGVCFSSGRARLFAGIYDRENIFIEKNNGGGFDDLEFGLDEATWRAKWLDCLRWFIGESLEK